MTPSSSEKPDDRPLAAVVDLGTNAARLAMAHLDAQGQLVSHGRWRELIRLGEGVAATKRISPDAFRRGLACLERFVRVIAAHPVDRLDAIATSVLRDAVNGVEFLEAAKEAGIPLRIIGAEEEARLAQAGALSSLGAIPPRAFVFDIGGGSLELIEAEGEEARKVASLPAGVVYLTERHLREMPTPAGEVATCVAEVRRLLAGSGFSAIGDDAVPLVGCGGTVALAWFVREGAPGLQGINGVELTREEISSWIPRFAGLSRAARTELEGFEPGREDVALAGLIVVREVIERLGREKFRVSTGGVREGRLLEMLKEN
ncbi:MAG: Ppx/GppA family phosphatase [bacterium]|nr:Ppx/GppA family phosphatase [bacterium]